MSFTGESIDINGKKALITSIQAGEVMQALSQPEVKKQIEEATRMFNWKA